MRLSRFWATLAVSMALATPVMAADMAKTRDPDVKITKIHDSIGITADEEAAWKPLAEIMRSNAKSNQAMYEALKANNSARGAIDKFKAQKALATQRVDHLTVLIPAMEKLYAVLTPAQRPLADAAFAPSRRQKAP